MRRTPPTPSPTAGMLRPTVTIAEAAATRPRDGPPVAATKASENVRAAWSRARGIGTIKARRQAQQRISVPT